MGGVCEDGRAVRQGRNVRGGPAYLLRGEDLLGDILIAQTLGVLKRRHGHLGHDTGDIGPHHDSRLADHRGRRVERCSSSEQTEHFRSRWQVFFFSGHTAFNGFSSEQ